MLTESPRAHIWLDVPDTCRMEAQFITQSEFRLVFGDLRADGHTLVFDRDALKRLRTLVNEVLETVAPGDPELVSVA
jgi:hypothetical protein